MIEKVEVRIQWSVNTEKLPTTEHFMLFPL